MADNQNPVPDLNRIINEVMSEHFQGVEEVHLGPQSETVTNVEPETQLAVEEPTEEERATKRQKTVTLKKKKQGATKTWSLQKLKIYGIGCWLTRASSAKEVLGN